MALRQPITNASVIANHNVAMSRKIAIVRIQAIMALTVPSSRSTFLRWNRSTITPTSREEMNCPTPRVNAKMPTQISESLDSSSTSHPWTATRTDMSTAAKPLWMPNDLKPGSLSEAKIFGSFASGEATLSRFIVVPMP